MPKLNYKTLRQEVADAIRQKILCGEFKPGERIKENDIAELFGVSRGPVREALRELEQEGMVCYERNVGCSVAVLTEQDVYEVCLLRTTLEILAVRLCKGKLSNANLGKMQQSVELMKLYGDDLPKLSQEDDRFHQRVVEQAGLPKLENIWKSVNIHDFAVFCAVKKEHMEQYWSRHQRLLDCYRSGDIEKISAELLAHYGLDAQNTSCGQAAAQLQEMLGQH